MNDEHAEVRPPMNKLRSTTLTILIAFGAIGGLHGIAEIIKAVGTLLASDSCGCRHGESQNQ